MEVRHLEFPEDDCIGQLCIVPTCDYKQNWTEVAEGYKPDGTDNCITAGLAMGKRTIMVSPEQRVMLELKYALYGSTYGGEGSTLPTYLPAYGIDVLCGVGNDGQLQNCAHMKDLVCIARTPRSSTGRVTDKGMKFLLHHQKLKQVSIGRNYGIKGPGLAYLSELPELETFTLDQCDQLNNDELHWLAEIPSLRSLEFTGPLDEGGLACLLDSLLSKKIPLKRLVFTSCARIKAKELQRISEMATLEELSISGDQFDINDLTVCMELPHLKKFALCSAWLFRKTHDEFFDRYIKPGTWKSLHDWRWTGRSSYPKDNVHFWLVR